MPKGGKKAPAQPAGGGGGHGGGGGGSGAHGHGDEEEHKRKVEAVKERIAKRKRCMIITAVVIGLISAVVGIILLVLVLPKLLNPETTTDPHGLRTTTQSEDESSDEETGTNTNTTSAADEEITSEKNVTTINTSSLSSEEKQKFKRKLRLLQSRGVRTVHIQYDFTAVPIDPLYFGPEVGVHQSSERGKKRRKKTSGVIANIAAISDALAKLLMQQ